MLDCIIKLFYILKILKMIYSRLKRRISKPVYKSNLKVLILIWKCGKKYCQNQEYLQTKLMENIISLLVKGMVSGVRDMSG